MMAEKLKAYRIEDPIEGHGLWMDFDGSENPVFGKLTVGKEGYWQDCIKDDAPLKLCVGFCKKYKEYDTVLVEAEQYESYCKAADLPVSPSKGEG